MFPLGGLGFSVWKVLSVYSRYRVFRYDVLTGFTTGFAVGLGPPLKKPTALNCSPVMPSFSPGT
jgi:hypothetical protein